MDYSIKSINPFVPPITTPSSQSYYLKGQSADYPTALLDFDGNERAGLHLRNSNLNVIHILFNSSSAKDLSPLSAASHDRRLFRRHRSRPAVSGRKIWTSSMMSSRPCVARPPGRANSARPPRPKNIRPRKNEFGRDDNDRRICIRSKQGAEFATRYGV